MTELSLESELELGNSEIVAAELESAVEEYPCREHLWDLLIEALANDNRRIEALRACRQLRDVLAAAGLQPQPRLTQLEDGLLTDGRIPRDLMAS